VILNGFENYSSDSTSVAVTGAIATETEDHQVRKTLDLCSSVTGYGEGGYGCPGDGTYDFSTTMDMPGNGGWWGTGFGATGDFEMIAHDGTLIGSCKMDFLTPPHSIGITSKVVFLTSVSILGSVIFVTVFLVFGQQFWTAQRMRRMRRYDDDSFVTKDTEDHTAKTILSGNTSANDDRTADDSGTYDDATKSTWSYDPSSVFTRASAFSGATEQQQPPSAGSQHLAKVWRIGGLLIDRIVNGKPLRTPPAQPEINPVTDDRSKTSYSTATDYQHMKDEAVEAGTSNNVHNNPTPQDYTQMEDNSVELTATSSSYSSVDLNCDSMDVQANDRRSRSRFACGANEIHSTVPATDAMYEIQAAAEKVQAMGKGLVDKAVADARWLMDNDMPAATRAPLQQPKAEVRDEYHDMKVYTIGKGDIPQYSGRVQVNEGLPVAYRPPESDDSTREDLGQDDSSIVPAAPRRQNVRFSMASECQQKERTSPKKIRMTSNDSLSVHKVVHGNQIHGTQLAANNSIGGKGSFEPLEKQDKWKRHDKWTAASLDQFSEL